MNVAKLGMGRGGRVRREDDVLLFCVAKKESAYEIVVLICDSCCARERRVLNCMCET